MTALTLSISLFALMGTVIGYPLMKLELKSAQQGSVRKIIEFFSRGLAIAVCVLPLFLFKFPAALLILVLMAAAGLGGIPAAIILVGGAGYLLGGEVGLLAVSVCPGGLFIPIIIIFFILRERTTSTLYTTLGIEENENESAFRKIKVAVSSSPQLSLRKTALFCSIAVIFVEFSPLDVDAIHFMYSKEKALPHLVQTAMVGREGATRALKIYGKEALPLELDILRDKFQKGWSNPPLTSLDNISRSDVAELTCMILEMGEAESLRQLGDNQKAALRAVASYSYRPAGAMAVEELTKLKAISELISLLDTNVYTNAEEALMQFRPDETIPLMMKWQINTKTTIYSNMNGFHIIENNFYAKALARYGESAVPVLIPYLGDESNVVSTLASDTLLLIGAPAVPALKKTLRSGNIRVVEQANYILGKLSIERD